MIAAILGILRRDLQRSARQRARLVAGVARPLLWVFLVGAGLQGIARGAGDAGYQAFAYPGGIVMAALFGGMLTGIATVYDREFGMLRLMLAAPAGLPAVLMGRGLSAALVGSAQALLVLALAPLVLDIGGAQAVRAAGAIIVCSVASAALGLLVASRIRSVDSFGGVINVVLFPLMFASGAFYPVTTMPAPLQAVARFNPVTAMADLMRHALGTGSEFPLEGDLLLLGGVTLVAFAGALLLFDPERRFVGGRRPR
jgi:ABC-2 type transport system permease protein